MADRQAHVEIINLGDELLLGLRTNTHLKYLGRHLSECGLAIERAHVIRDEPEAIRRCFKEAWERADIVITTGGLGPTCDDNTREVIADALGLELVRQPEIEASIRAHFERRGLTMPDNNLRQARVPVGAQVLPNHSGTAPGLWIEHRDKYLILLPGPSSELEPIFEQSVLPRLRQAGILRPYPGYLQIRIIGRGESQVAAVLQPLFDSYGSGLQVAYCAHASIVDVRLSAAPERVLTESQIQEIGEACRERLGQDCIGYGEVSLVATIFDHLRRKAKTLAVAESCTGGLLADTLTDEPGASAVFQGGVVCYSEKTKLKQLGIAPELIKDYGAVSAECAQALATAVANALQADYALSTTGFIGPGGGTPDYPVGTVFIGCHSPTRTTVKRIQVAGERPAAKRRIVNSALDSLRRELL